MIHKEIEEYRRRLVEIQKVPDKPAGSREAELKELAREVGASTISRQGAFNASEPELKDNINEALRTASMIDMCKTANRNFIIALIATVIALGSAVAAWIAVLSK